MSDVFHEVEEVVEDVIHEFADALHEEEEIISHSHHPKLEHWILLGRNISVSIAVVLFAISLFHVPFYGILKAVAYFLGATAYFGEILLMTDCFSQKVPHQEMFMAYCFGPMYILLGLSYLLSH
jgi:hypothetical protein